MREQLVNSFCELSSDFARLENAQRLLPDREVSRLPFPIRPYDGFFSKKYGAGEPWIDNWKEFAIFYRLEKIVEAAGRRLASR
jgi:hypothetical protein